MTHPHCRPARVAAAALAALGLCSPAAHAQPQPQSPPATGNVVIYGLMDAALRHASNAAASRASLTSMEDGVITGSRLGFRGREDLGGGLSAGFTLEGGIDLGTGSATLATAAAAADYGVDAAASRFFGRQSFVNLRGPLGGITLGRQYTVAHEMAVRWQPLGNPNHPAFSLFSSHHVPRQDNLLRLDGKVAGVELVASRTFGEQTRGDSANSAWALGAGYSQGAWSLSGVVQQMNNRAGTETRQIAALGGNYRLNGTLSLFGGLMQRKAALSLQKNTVWALGANVELHPLVTLSVQHLNDRQRGSAALTGSRRVSWVQASYRFSKRSDVYGGLDQNRVAGGYAKPAFMGTTGTQTGTTFGLRHRF